MEDQCVCPIHQTPLLYNEVSEDHACQNIMCLYAHGFVAMDTEIRRQVKQRIDQSPRGAFETAGSPHNLAGLRQLLKGWKCCANPQSCGAWCMSDELHLILSQALVLVEKAILDKYGQETLDKIRES